MAVVQQILFALQSVAPLPGAIIMLHGQNRVQGRLSESFGSQIGAWFMRSGLR